MPQDDPAFPQSLGAGGADEILAQCFKHAAPGHAGDVGGIGRAERDGRQNLMGRRCPPHNWEPVVPQAEHQHQQRPEYESGDANPKHSKACCAVIEQGILSERGQDARAQAEDQGEGQCIDAQFNRDGKPQEEPFPHGTRRFAEGGAEIESGQARQIIPVLPQQRAVHVVMGFELG